MKRADNSNNLPPGWTPESDADRQWEGLVHLMREADQPREPGREAFEDIRAAIREQIEEERHLTAGKVVPVQPRESFVPWARQIFVGGGPGAQALRLAAVGLLGFVLAQGFGVRTALSPTQNSGESVAAFHEPAPALDSSAAATPVSVEDASLYSALDRSGIDSSGRMKSDSQAIAGLGLGAGNLSGDTWYQYSHFGGVPVSLASSQPSGGQDAIRLLQQLRVNALVSNDAQTMDAVRQLEAHFARDSKVSGQQAQILALLRQGEELAAKGFTGEALDTYGEVQHQAPGSFVAFLAEFQSARLNFEVLQDYEAALRNYRSILENYPQQYLSARHQEHIRGRIEMLAANYAQNWQAVRLWQQAQNAPGAQQSELLGLLVATAPQSPLAGEAARQLAAADSNQRMNPETLVEALSVAIARSREGSGAANLQFSKAEIIYQQLRDTARAAEEYRKVLQMPGGKELAPKVNLRLQQIESGGVGNP